MIGIAIGAVGIPQEIIDRCVKSIHDSRPSVPYRVSVQSGDRPDGPINRAAIRNAAMRKLIPFCDKIVCVDVDTLIPPRLIDETDKSVKPGQGIVVHCRRVHDYDGEYRWDSWMSGSPYGDGGYVAMTTIDWMRIGGWDERLENWGGEDSTLIRRARRLRVAMIYFNNWPLPHIEHPLRDAKNDAVAKANLRAGISSEFKQFLAPSGPGVLGIAVAAVGVEPEVVERFQKSLEDSGISCPHMVAIETGDRPAGALNRSAMRNAAMRKLLPYCDKIVCVDVDMLIPPGLMDYLAGAIQKGRGALVRCRRVQYDGEYHWQEWLRGKQCGEGGCLGMSSEDWARVGGWDERLENWGSEDTVVLRRCEILGIDLVPQCDWPLVHVEHPKRDPENKQIARDNLAKGMAELWPQYLTAQSKIPACENIMWIWVTSRCAGRCPTCSQDSLMKMEDYDMSLEELDRLIRAIAVSRYRFSEVCLTGGDSLLWKNLEYGVEKIWRAGFGPISMFTNGTAPALARAISPMVGKIQVSQYHWNTDKIPAIRAVPRVNILDRTKHWVMPTTPFGVNMLPVECVGSGFLIHKDRAYPCCNLPAIGLHLGVKLDDIPHTDVSPGFVERTILERSKVEHLCRGCLGNQKVQRALKVQEL